jgi:hypothetical protein
MLKNNGKFCFREWNKTKRIIIHSRKLGPRPTLLSFPVIMKFFYELPYHTVVPLLDQSGEAFVEVKNNFFLVQIKIILSYPIKKDKISYLNRPYP